MVHEERGSAWETYGLDQAVVEGWVRRTFGDALMDNPKERARRVVEEAIETLRVAGVSQQEAQALVQAVYAKPPGELRQEIGGVVVTLLALCAHHNMRLDDTAKTEISRILSKDHEGFR